MLHLGTADSVNKLNFLRQYCQILLINIYLCQLLGLTGLVTIHKSRIINTQGNC